MTTVTRPPKPPREITILPRRRSFGNMTWLNVETPDVDLRLVVDCEEITSALSGLQARVYWVSKTTDPSMIQVSRELELADFPTATLQLDSPIVRFIFVRHPHLRYLQALQKPGLHLALILRWVSALCRCPMMWLSWPRDRIGFEAEGSVRGYVLLLEY